MKRLSFFMLSLVMSGHLVLAQVAREGVFGTVTKVDATAISVKTSAGTIRTLTLTEKTEVRRAGKPMQLADIKAGDEVAVFVQPKTLSAIGVEVVTPPPPPASNVTLTLVTTPRILKVGQNDFDVTVKSATTGKPVTNATVSVRLHMPPIPDVHMPEMDYAVDIIPAGDGKFHGSGQVIMAGRWDITVLVRQNGVITARQKRTVTVK